MHAFEAVSWKEVDPASVHLARNLSTVLADESLD